jgi:tripartite-type tricarboxylate transporter receptor subunit TctC
MPVFSYKWIAAYRDKGNTMQVVKSRRTRRLLAVLGFGLAGLGWAAPGSAADNYPDKPIRFIVPFAPGGTAELVGRVAAEELSKQLNTNVIVELRPGAGGNIGAETVAKSTPDGYTILLGSSSLASNISLMKMNFDPRKDLIAVAGIAMVPNIMEVGKDSPFKSVADVLAYAKANPGKLTFGSSGQGTSSHLSGELFKSVTGADILHVPYKGSGQVYPDLISGRVDLLFDLQGSALTQIKSGNTRALATTGPKRSASLPDVPTIAELGYPGYENGSWLGIMAPAGVPAPIVKRLADAMEASLKSPLLQQRIAEIGGEPIPVQTAAFNQYFLADVARWQKLVQSGDLKPVN